MVMLDLLNVGSFKSLSSKELKSIKGGIDISGAIITAYTKAIDAVMEVGRSLGTALKRIIGRNTCPLK